MSFYDNFPYVPGVSEKFGFQLTFNNQDIKFKTYIDYDLFYAYLADTMIFVPSIVEFVEEQYACNKLLYYDKASKNPQYNATIMSDARTERTTMVKRAFGILLAAQEDEALQAKICNLFISVFPPLRKLKKPFRPHFFDELYSQWLDLARSQKWDPLSMKGFDVLAPYVVDHYLGLNNNPNLGVITAKLSAIAFILKKEDINRESFHKIISNTNARDFIKTPAAFREFKSLIQNNDDIQDALSILRVDDLEGIKDACRRNPKLASIFSYLTDPNNTEAQTRMKMTIRNVSQALQLAGIDLTMYIHEQPLTDDEFTLLYKIAARNYRFLQDSSNRLVDIQPTDYLLVIVLYQIAKAIKSDSAFFFKNSAESLFFELEAAHQKIEESESIVAKKNQEVNSLQQQVASLSEQINLLREELLKDTKDATKDATKPLMAEISMLNNQLSSLKHELEGYRQQQKELHRLREFVFDMPQGYDIPAEDISLEKLIDGKRIYIFGGHINWRNKIKQKYPKLEILDGHNTSFDEQKLINADKVLLNTSNMSHALYYKIIDVLRKNNIPFDYLGKYHNPELLEKEIADSLK